MGKKKSRPTPVPADFVPHLIDAHTHLDSFAEQAAVIERARAAGVEKLCTVGDDVAESERCIDTARAHEGVFAAVAIHPTKAHELDDDAKRRLTELANDPPCVAVGETGLDQYWIDHEPETTAPLDVQEASLRWHIDLACATGKALMIHNREADADLLRILDDAPKPGTVILHCFSSPFDVAKQALDRGYVLSMCGNVTFKRNDYLREAAAYAPADQILIETDAPYMTPEPFRGARNEPSLIGHTANCIAAVRGVKVEDLAVQLSANFDTVYSL